MAILSVMIDSREPEWVQKLTFGGVPVAATLLDAADVWIATEDGLLLVERKTPSDLLNTLRDGDRLFGQCANMREYSQWCYLLITGELQRGANGKVWCEQRETGWSWDSVQGALLTIQELGVGVIHCSGDTDFEAAVMRLSARDRDTKRIEPPRLSHVLGHGEAVLAALPGVGLERVDALLQNCGTPAWSLVALTDDTVVPGIGDGTKRRVREALGLDDWAEFTILVREEGNERK